MTELGKAVIEKRLIAFRREILPCDHELEFALVFIGPFVIFVNVPIAAGR